VRLLAILPLVLATLWGNGGSPIQQAPRVTVRQTNRLESNLQAKRAGAKLYARECAACHGPNREGRGKAPSLNQAEVYQAPAGALFWVLRNGSLRRGMPSFAHLPEQQRWQIITFLQGDRVGRDEHSPGQWPLASARCSPGFNELGTENANYCRRSP
jgi:mono/diheme cytochrome c family protein